MAFANLLENLKFPVMTCSEATRGNTRNNRNYVYLERARDLFFVGRQIRIGHMLHARVRERISFLGSRDISLLHQKLKVVIE